MVMPMPHILVFHWPLFMLMNCSFFIGYYFTPTYCMCSNINSVDFLHGWTYLSKHPLCSTTPAGQSDILVLTLFILLTANVFITGSVGPQHLLVAMIFWYSLRWFYQWPDMSVYNIHWFNTSADHDILHLKFF